MGHRRPCDRPAVHDLLGGRIRDKVAVYATGLYYTRRIPGSPAGRSAQLRRRRLQGMKTKVGGLPIDEDVRRVAALREAIGRTFI